MSDISPETHAGGAGQWRPKLGRRGLILVAMAIIAAGMALNWGWLTAIGAAPLILAVAPCAVVCGLGYCAMCKSDSCDKTNSPTEASITRD
ncbi:MAG: hypothetical protein CL812_04330 [Confluentimicrobium sp.]|nr:hypothetical protein [Actibacterium sp.]|tara:strand:- start:4927 stop:5199 length:273 start_codon:yes stop_codon:yes gene_type:complete